MREIPVRAIVAFVLAAVAAVVFLSIARLVVADSTGTLDRELSLWVHGFDSPAADLVMRAMSKIGEYASIAAAATLVALWCLHRGAKRAAIVVAVTSVGAMLLTTVVKLLFRRTRPDLFLEVALPETWSFPSGHSLVSFAAYGIMAFVAARLAPRLRLPLAVLTPLLVLSIGISRVYLGVHWPTDVAAGFAAGLIVLVVATRLLGPVTETAESLPGARRG